MDDRRFDEISKHLGTGLTRKGILRLLGGLGAAGVSAAGVLLPAEAKKKHARNKHDKNNSNNRDNHKRDNDNQNAAAAQPVQPEAKKAKGKGKGKKHGKNKKQNSSQSQPQNPVSIQADSPCGSGKKLICHKAGGSGNYTTNCVSDSAVCQHNGHAGHSGDCVCQGSGINCPGEGFLQTCSSDNVACGGSNGSNLVCTGCGSNKTACGQNCCSSSETCCDGTCVATNTLCGGKCGNVCSPDQTCCNGTCKATSSFCGGTCKTCDSSKKCCNDVCISKDSCCNDSDCSEKVCQEADCSNGRCSYTPVTDGQQGPGCTGNGESCCDGKECCGKGEICTGQGCCAPKTCENDYKGKCGTFDDGCGGRIECGCGPDSTCCGEQCVPTSGICGEQCSCGKDETCCGEQCVPTSGICGEQCSCSKDETCCGGKCVPTSGICGDQCSCGKDETCCDGRCVPTSGICGEQCSCEEGESCCGGECVPTSGICGQECSCDVDETCCGGRCVPTSGICGERCSCGEKETCCEGTCIPAGGCCGDSCAPEVCQTGVCTEGTCNYTPSGNNEPGPLCDETGQFCCNTDCCEAGDVCTGEGCCTPDTCEGTYAGQCGTFPNGCGGTDLVCGCGVDQQCVNGVCVEIPQCIPVPIEQACAGLKCGPASNGCGVDYECGLCPTKKKKGQRPRKQTCVAGVCKPFKKKRCIGSGLAGQPCSSKCKCANGRKCNNGNCCETVGDGSRHCTANNDCCPGLICAYRRPGQHRVCMPKNAKDLGSESTGTTATPGIAVGAALTGLAAKLGAKLTGNGEAASVAMDEVQIHALGPRD